MDRTHGLRVISTTLEPTELMGRDFEPEKKANAKCELLAIYDIMNRQE